MSEQTPTQKEKRYDLIISLTRMEVAEMNPAARAVWERLVKGGWYTEDLEAALDKLVAVGSGRNEW